MSTQMTGPPNYSHLLKDQHHKIKFADEGDIESIMSSKVSIEDEQESHLKVTPKAKAKSIYVQSDSEEESEAEPSAVSTNKNSIGLIYENADQFSTFEDLMRIDKVSTKSFYRVPFDIKGGKMNFFALPWPTMQQKMKNALNILSKSKNVYYKLDGLFFLWTPLLTHEKTKVAVAITDRRGRAGKPTVVNKVGFESHNVTMSGMSIGNCVHQDDLSRVELSVALAESIASKGVKYATLEVCFYISVSSRASLETHSVIGPLVVPPEVKNLLKDYKKTAEFLRQSNAKVIKKLKREEEDFDLGSELSGRTERVGPSVTTERIKALSKQITDKPSTHFGLSEISFRES